MKNLKDTILEKLKVDDIILPEKFPINKKFPINGTLQDIVEFLEDAGFKKVSTSPNWVNSFEKYKKYNDKCYAVSSGTTTYIEIINRANPKLKNKLLYIKLNSTINIYNIFDDITTAKREAESRQVSKEEFLKELSEIL